MMAQIKC